MFPAIRVLFILIFLLSPEISFAQKIQFFGDVLLSRGIEELVNKEGMDSAWKGVVPLLKEGAINVANLEGAVGDKSLCAKGHIPCFNIDSSMMNILKKFNVIGLANNHSLDLGLSGLRNTIREIEKRGMIPLGGEKFSTIIRTEDGDIGIVALTDLFNSSNDRKHFVMPESPKAINEIRRLKGMASFVVVYIHWGSELDKLPTDRMRELARTFINSGADIIVGHHPHVVGTVECIKGRPVVYSLGNFLFDQKYEETKKGAVLQCEINKESRLLCKLRGVMTPMNSFTPYTLEDKFYGNENRLLASCAPKVMRTWTGIFSGGGKETKLVLKRGEPNSSLSSLEMYDSGTGQRLWESPYMPIEKLQPVDLNGDGLSEIMLIQNVYSPLDNEIGKRVYIYGFDKGLRALWRGSALSRPLLDAVFIDNPKDGRPILVALHTADSFLVRDPSSFRIEGHRGSLGIDARFGQTPFYFSGPVSDSCTCSPSGVTPLCRSMGSKPRRDGNPRATVF